MASDAVRASRPSAPSKRVGHECPCSARRARRRSSSIATTPADSCPRCCSEYEPELSDVRSRRDDRERQKCHTCSSAGHWLKERQRPVRRPQRPTRVMIDGIAFVVGASSSCGRAEQRADVRRDTGSGTAGTQPRSTTPIRRARNAVRRGDPLNTVSGESRRHDDARLRLAEEQRAPRDSRPRA